ncbi:MAG TPA: FG-GAP-like repeat-containing protein, partial [Gemmatimonadales bacterium]|nr:FG-GAP-like repeat-containing protein [Gemmatimonadales bacterium]
MSQTGLARAAVALTLGLLGCHAAAPAAWHDEAGYRWRELSVPRGTPGFTSLPGNRTGIVFQNSVSDSALLYNRILAQGAGVALGDVDGDGLVDVFLAKSEGANALYRNLGGWRFEDITASAGVAAADRYSTGAALADTDGDGDLDLILLATTGPNAIFVNDGTGHFTEHRADLGLDPAGKGGTTPAMADIDGDGDLDLYVANYKPYSPVDSISPQQRAFNQIVREVSPGKFEVRPEFRKDFRIVLRPDMGGLNLSMRADPDDFYLNEGGHFVREPLTSGRFTGAALADTDGDGDLDLILL